MTDLHTAYRSIQSLGTIDVGSITDTLRVVAVPAAGNSTPLAGALIELPDFQSHLLAGVTAQIAALQAKPGNGAFAAPINLNLTGLITGTASFDGSADFNLATAMADGALDMSKVSGLAAALAALQQDIDDKGGFDSTADLILDKNGTTSPLFGMAASDGTRAQWSYSSNSSSLLRLDTRASDGTLTNRLLWNFTSGVASLKASWQVMGLNIAGPGATFTVTDTTASKVTLFNALGQINTSGGTTYYDLWHKGNLDTSTFLTAANALGTAIYVSDINATPASTLGYWNASSTNITGLDNFGTLFATQAYNGTNTFYNQLALGTNGTLVWRRRVDTGAWSTNTLWHSGNLTPSNFVQTGQALTVPSLSLFDGTSGHATSKFAVGSDGTITITSTPSGSSATIIATLAASGIRPNVPIYAKTITADVGSLPGMALMAIYNGSNVGGIYASPSHVTLGLNGSGLAVFTDGSMVGSSLTLENLSVTDNFTYGGSEFFIPNVPVEAGTFLADSSAQLANNGTYISYNDGSDEKSWFQNLPTGAGGGFVFRAYNGGNPVTILDMSPTTTTASGSWTFASSTVINGASLTINPSNEGHITLGQSGVYLYGNSTSIGAYGSSFGAAYSYTFSSKVFAITGTLTQTSDERLKTKFAPMQARPLWQVIPLESWEWIKEGLAGHGPRAQNVLKHAPEYIDEDKEATVAEMTGQSKYEIKAELAKIAAGEAMGVLSVDKIGLALEIGYAAGQMVDALKKEVDELRKSIASLQAGKSKDAPKK